MAMTREEIELQLKVLGDQGVDDLRQKVAGLKSQIGETAAAMTQADADTAALEQEFQRLASQVKNLEGVLNQLEAAQAREAAAAQKAADAQAKAAQKAADAQAKAVEQSLAAMQRKQAAADRAAAAEEARAKREADRAAGQVKSFDDQATGAGKYRQNLTALGYALNDFFSVSGSISQRLNAISNNLPGILAGFGNIGLALSGVVPIISIVIQNWGMLEKKVDEVLAGIVGNGNWEAIKEAVSKAFGDAVTEAKDKVETLKDTIKRLEKEPHKLSVDYADLELAKRELDRIQEGLSLIDRLRKHQQEPEKQSGEAVTKALEGAEGGTGKVLDDLKVKFQEEMLNSKTGDLGATKREIAETRADIQKKTARAGELELAGQAPAAASVRGKIDELKKKLTDLEKKQGDQETEITKSGGLADQKAAELIRQSVQGKGGEQAKAQKDLADALKGAGQGKLAGQIGGLGAKRFQEEQDFDEEAEKVYREQVKAKDDLKKANDERKRIQQESLDELLRSKELDASNDKHAEAVNKLELSQLEKYQRLKDQVQQDILESLKRQGVDVRNAEEITARAAAQEAEQAFGRLDRAGQKAKKDTAKAENKEVKGEEQAFDAEANRVFAAIQAEAKRFQQAFGKEALARLAEEFNANPWEDPEELAQKFAAELAGFFRERGARGGAANLAAQQVVGRAGFNVGLAQLRQQPAQPPRGRVARPKAGKKPPPRAVAAKPKPGAKPKAIAAKGKPVPAPAPRRPIPPEVQEEARRRGINLPGGGNQASLIQPIQGTQQAVAGTQMAVARVENQVAMLNATVRQLQTNAQRLNNRAVENKASVQRGGSSVV